MTSTASSPVALITGASRGLGRALALDLHASGWRLVLDARGSVALAEVAELAPGAVTVAGDVTDPRHRDALAAAVHSFGGIDLLVNNASDLGPSPLPRLAEHGLDALRRVYETNVIAPLALVQLLLPALRESGGTVIDISSDAAVEAYEAWGGYGSSKAALDHLSAILAAEEPAIRVFAVDPGDMRTDLHQQAFPGEDISDRPLPGTVVPALRRLLEVRPASGRYRAADWAVAGGRPMSSALADFALPHALEASAPPSRRDGVRLLVASTDGIRHAHFDRLGEFLHPGDLVVVNTSGTLSAAVNGTRADGSAVTVHFSTELADGQWVVEVRPARRATGPVPDLRADEPIVLPDGIRLVPLAPHPSGQHRLWRSRIAVEGGLPAYLAHVGRPIRYGYVHGRYPASAYQTVFAREPGSAEMPSAGRPFTTDLVTDLVTRGITVAPITLHTGVSSQDVGEPPQAERFAVPEATARQVNMTLAWGNRVVAVGTTVTRALESAANVDGVVHERAGWTDLVLGPDRPAQVVTGLVTGWHGPGASHLQLLQAVAGGPLVERAYDEALRARYLWHEFGDSCLLLP